MTHYIKHEITCPPGCHWDECTCVCHDHSAACWPGKPDPACVCQQDELPDTLTDEDIQEDQVM